MNPPLLTIIVPTYNRAECLQTLLGALAIELAGLKDKVDVVIGDNASTDDTPERIRHFVEQCPQTRVLRHDRNLGPDENFCRCVEQVRSDYFWIIGDDDLPRAGVVAALLALLDDTRPDLVYLNSHWSETLPGRTAQGPLATPFDATTMNRLTFARRVHVWTSFISGCIVKRALAPDAALRRYTGTNLVQLGWVMEALRQGERFVHVREASVFATAGNTGGYAVLKVFGDHFPRIVRESLSSTAEQRGVARAIVMRTILMYLPELLWNLRMARAGKFEPENVAAALRPQLGGHPLTLLLLLPVSRAPMPIARMMLSLGRVAGRLVSIGDRLRMKLSRGGAVA